MPTLTTGTFFLRSERDIPVEVRDDDARGFRVILRAFDRQGEHAVEAYEVAYRGDEARAWHAEHGAALRPGLPLRLVLRNPRSFYAPGGKTFTRADVVSVEFGELPPSWQAARERSATQ